MMVTRPSPKHCHYYPLTIRFHQTGGQHDPHSVRPSVPSELFLGVYHGMTIVRLGQVRSAARRARQIGTNDPVPRAQTQAAKVLSIEAQMDLGLLGPKPKGHQCPNPTGPSTFIFEGWGGPKILIQKIPRQSKVTNLLMSVANSPAHSGYTTKYTKKVTVYKKISGKF